jgi:hypothetical protein
MSANIFIDRMKCKSVLTVAPAGEREDMLRSEMIDGCVLDFREGAARVINVVAVDVEGGGC